MPELAEVEFMSRRLDEWLTGAPLQLELLDPKLDPNGDLRKLPTLQVERVFRRAKYSVIQGASDSLVLHFRMTGKVLRSVGAAASNPSGEGLSAHQESGIAVPKYTRARFVGARETVHFIDVRRFGTIERIPTSGLEAFFQSKKLGAEVWPERQSGAWWQAQFAGLKSPVKSALLRQDRIVGLGNILASEILFHARVSPDRPVNELLLTEWDALAEGLHQTVATILATGAGDAIAYVNEGASAEASGFQVYQRAGDAAPCCGGQIERRVDAGRATFWCPACQS